MSNPTAFVLLDESVKLIGSTIHQSLAARHQDQALAIAPDNGSSSNTIVLNLSGEVVTLTQVDRPLPDGWQPIARRSVTHWPEAQTVFARHRAHIAVGVIGESNDRLHVARVITGVVGALVVAYPSCSGVLWDLTVANSAPIVAELSALAFAPVADLPSALWISMHPFHDPGSPLVGAVTMGLSKFVGREVEFEGPASQLKSVLMTARELVTYLLANGVNVRDGDTIGRSANERIPVRFKASDRFNGLPVIAVEFSPA
jgi:Domain of unknown function (DUF4261)